MAAHWPADRQCAGSVADLDAFAPLYASSEGRSEGSAQGSGQGSGQAVDQARPVRHGPASLPISRILDWVKDGRPAWHTLDPHRHAPLNATGGRATHRTPHHNHNPSPSPSPNPNPNQVSPTIRRARRE